MEFSTWLLYVSIISILIFSPGPSALLCVSDGLKFGNKRTIPTILGGAVAALVLMTISAVGLGAILVTSETLFFIIKIVGALYLIYLGWSSWKDDAIKVEVNAPSENKSVNYSWTLLLRKGFLVGISNPKDLLFFIALFPGFMNADLPQVEQYMVLACTWFVIDCTSMFMYAGLGSKISPFLSKSRNLNIVNRTVGSVFIFLGGALAISAGASRDMS
ncbi:LysE family translocator [Oceanisphaera arctica]|uniref:Amino acid transporter n=1 Tax=Oceanisphaera arctica TaxID=641510 RepID=A0A2P5TQP2_9GAMM|nr:LysE family translocator [Oceanisphaera arctica]PPL18100.1 amino acid transporter [Oceanisphaera arctica]GHA09817.1 lysine transporter LysE [Oceanisphaera arctica]